MCWFLFCNTLLYYISRQIGNHSMWFLMCCLFYSHGVLLKILPGFAHWTGRFLACEAYMDNWPVFTELWRYGIQDFSEEFTENLDKIQRLCLIHETSARWGSHIYFWWQGAPIFVLNYQHSIMMFLFFFTFLKIFLLFLQFGEVAPGLLKDYSVPHLFQEDFFDVLDRDQRPPFRWLIVGPERSGASWHIDPALTSAWNTLLCGRKR